MSDLLPTTLLMQILCYPWLELKYELNAMFIENKHMIRSAVRICSIALATCLGLYLVVNNPAVLEFFAGIIKSLEFVPVAMQTQAATALAVLAASSFGAYTSKAGVRSFCKCKFGDPDFFLTNKRKAELVQIFQAQEIEIPEDLIQHVVDFCVHNLRNSHPSSEMGTTPKDWERILNSLIYDADLDLFLDQQAALQTKHQRILDKQAAIHAYTASISFQHTPETVDQPQLLFTQQSNTTRSISEPPHNSTLPTIIETCPTLPPENEKTPLLIPQRTGINSRHSSTSSENKTPYSSPATFNNSRSFGKSSEYSLNRSTDNITTAQQTLAHFKHVHQKKHKVHSSVSEDQLLAQCSRHLEHKAFCTNKCILNTPSIERISKQLPSPNFYQI